jgi:intracellular septation protein A
MISTLDIDDKRHARGMLLLGLAPAAIYFVAHLVVSSTTVCLALGGGIPMLYQLAECLRGRRPQTLALLSSVGFCVAGIVALATGGSSLPLKLYDPLITFGFGAVLVGAVVMGRPLPVGRFVKVPAEKHRALGLLLGGFLVAHAMLTVVLAVSLPTSTYVALSKTVGWGTIALGVVGLSTYCRRQRTAG